MVDKPFNPRHQTSKNPQYFPTLWNFHVIDNSNKDRQFEKSESLIKSKYYPNMRSLRTPNYIVDDKWWLRTKKNLQDWKGAIIQDQPYDTQNDLFISRYPELNKFSTKINILDSKYYFLFFFTLYIN